MPHVADGQWFSKGLTINLYTKPTELRTLLRRRVLLGRGGRRVADEMKREEERAGKVRAERMTLMSGVRPSG